MKNKLLFIIIGFMLLGGLSACGIYTFSGTSIQPDVKTFSISYFEYKAATVDPNLSQMLTEEIRNKFKRMTSLEEVDSDGDLQLSGAITGYNISPMAVTADEVASQNRLTVTVEVTFVNKKHKADNFKKTFSAYSDYDSSNSLDAVQSTLSQEIVDKLSEDIFNASVANW